MGTAVRDNFVEKCKAKEDFVKKEGGDPFGGNGFLGRAENYPFSKPMVYHDHERIEAGGYGEIRDKIAGDLLEGTRGDGLDRGQGRYGGVCVSLVLLAESTALNIAADIGSEARPPEFGGDQLASFQEAGMTGGLVIMAALEDGTAEGIVRRDIDAAFVCEDTGVDLPVSEAGAEGERNILMHGLECLEDEGVAGRGGFNAVGEGGVDEIDEERRREEGDIGVVGVVSGEEVRSAGEGIRAG